MDHQFLYSVEDAADRLGLGRSKTYELVSAGTIHSVKIGTRRLVPVEALSEFVRSLVEEAGDQVPTSA